MVLAAGAGPRTIAEILREAGAPVWTILDGASCAEMPELVAENGGVCLYRADSPEDAPHAPWLLRVAPETPIADDLGFLAGEQHWGIVFASEASERDLRNHFRKFTMLWTPADENAPVYFRFYDPRVMGDAVQALTPEHLSHLVAPMTRLYVPVSPLLGGFTGLSPLASRDVFRGDFLELALPEGPPVAQPAAFHVSGTEYNTMSRLHAVRSRRKLARDLRIANPAAPDAAVMATAERAPDRARHYGLASLNQVMTFAQAMLIFGPEFDKRHSEAAEILNRGSSNISKKADDLRDWYVGARDAKRAGTPLLRTSG